MRLSRAMLDALMPPGTLWMPEEGEGLDNLLDGISDCLETVRVDVMQLARVRDPLRTSLLEDLEREYAVIPRAGSDEATRRQRLAGVKAAGSGDGSLTFLQSMLDKAGFNLQVHANNPPVDPGFFILYRPSAIFGNNSSSFGRAACGAKRGELLVNGDIYHGQEVVKYEIPTDPGYWPLFFFVGGAATRNEAGELTAIEDGDVPALRRGELITLILKCKPMHAWAGLRIKYV